MRDLLLGRAREDVTSQAGVVMAQRKIVYKVSPYVFEGDEVTWLNESNDLRAPGPHKLPTIDRMQIGSGFSTEMARPVLKFNLQKPKLDAYYLSASIWCVSDALHRLLIKADPNAFDSVLAETRLRDGTPGPVYWLIEIVRFCDCFDEEQSRLAGAHVEQKIVDLALGAPDGNIFDASTIGNAIFSASLLQR